MVSLIAVKISVSSSASQLLHMEKYFKSTISNFRFSKMNLLKPSSLLTSVDPSQDTCSRVKVIYLSLPRNGDERSTC